MSGIILSVYMNLEGVADHQYHIILLYQKEQDDAHGLYAICTLSHFPVAVHIIEMNSYW